MPGKTKNTGHMKETKESGFKLRLLIQFRLHGYMGYMNYMGKSE